MSTGEVRGMTSWPVLGLEEHTLSTGYRGRWGWCGGTTHVGSVTLPCSALLERTASLRPPHLWLPGRLGHCETPEEDGRSGRGVVGVRALCSVPRGISAGSHVPTEAPAPSPRCEPPLPGHPGGSSSLWNPSVLPASDVVPRCC